LQLDVTTFSNVSETPTPEKKAVLDAFNAQGNDIRSILCIERGTLRGDGRGAPDSANIIIVKDANCAVVGSAYYAAYGNHLQVAVILKDDTANRLVPIVGKAIFDDMAVKIDSDEPKSASVIYFG